MQLSSCGKWVQGQVRPGMWRGCSDDCWWRGVHASRRARLMGYRLCGQKCVLNPALLAPFILQCLCALEQEGDSAEILGDTRMEVSLSGRMRGGQRLRNQPVFHTDICHFPKGSKHSVLFLFSIVPALSFPLTPYLVKVRQREIILHRHWPRSGRRWPSWTPAPFSGLVGLGVLRVRGPGGVRGKALRAQALNLEALPSERGPGFILSLFQGRNRLGGGCMLCEPDLAKYIRRHF